MKQKEQVELLDKATDKAIKQVEKDLDYAIESLVESLEEVMERFYLSEHKHTYGTEYLNIDTEIVDNGDFVGEVLGAVSVVVKDRDAAA